MNNILVVGAGFSGVTIARELAECGYDVTIVDSKSHIGGHCYDYEDATGIRVHKYGPHIFHTSNDKVIDWLSRFTDWIDYEHRVVAELDNGALVPFPPNSETVQTVKPEKVLDTFYRPYSEKMWGMPLERISPKIIQRVPIRQDAEDRYFPKEKFQKLPKQGYTALISNILSHDRIEVKLQTPFKKGMVSDYGHIFNSMSIDDFFDYKFGYLPYRSIKFHEETHKTEFLTTHPVINYTDSLKFTRHTEWKNFPGHGANSQMTVVTYEEPCDFRDNSFQRYYPVVDPDGKNKHLYEKYRSQTPSNMTFIGRCGMYVYIDMDQAVSAALSTARKFLEKKNHE